MKKLQQLYRRAARHVDLDVDATEVIKVRVWRLVEELDDSLAGGMDVEAR